MNDPNEILISLKPKHADRIFKGSKTVELRKRRLKVQPGARIWIYATAPIAAIRGYASLDRIEEGSPAQIWRAMGDCTDISRAEFDAYFANCDVAYGLVLADVMEMEVALTLDRIREIVNDFHPPQFYCHLNGERESMRLFSRKYRPVKAKQSIEVAV